MRTFEIAFQLAGKINSSFGSMFSSAADRMRQLNQQTADLRRKLKTLEQAQKKAARIKELQEQIAETEKRFSSARREVDTLAVEISQASSPSRELKKQFKEAESAVDKLKSKLATQRAELEKLETAFSKAGYGGRDLASEYAELTAQIEKAEEAQKRFARVVGLQEKTSRFRDSMQTNMINSAQTAAAFAAPVVAAAKFESSMADVKKVVDFETPEQFKEMERDILNLSKRIPMAATELARIVAAGGQAGIAKEDLLGFAENAAKMGVAFDISADEAGQMMAQWQTAFKMNQQQVVTLADQINYLGNTTAASAPRISEVVRRIGPLGEVGGAAAAQIAALGATMVGAGVEEEVAATGIKNMILSLVAGESATKSQADALQALGMDAKQMAAMMQQDAQGAIISVFQALQKLPKEKQAAVLSELFGKESIGAIAPLLTALDKLQKNFKKVGDASQYAGSMQKEFKARSEATEDSMQLLENNIFAVGKAIGDIYLPTVRGAAEKLSALSNKIQAFAEKHPTLTRALAIGAASAVGLALAVSAVGFAISTAILPFINFYTWIKKVELAQKAAQIAGSIWSGTLQVLRVGISAVTLAQRLLNAAFLANPVGFVIGVLALLAAGLVALYNRSEKVRAVIDAMWNGLKIGAESSINFVIDKINELIGWLNRVKIPDWVPLLGGKGVNIRQISRVDFTGELPGHAAGGIFNKPHIAWFAEKGPEAVIPLNNTRQAVSIWVKAGERLGVMPPSTGTPARPLETTTSSKTLRQRPEAVGGIGYRIAQIGSIMEFVTKTQNKTINEDLKQAKSLSQTTGTAKRFASVADITQRRSSKLKDETIIEKLKYYFTNTAASRIQTVRAYAEGGILARPHLGLVAEEGPEAIIPLAPEKRKTALNILQKAGHMLGVKTIPGFDVPLDMPTNFSSVLSQIRETSDLFVSPGETKITYSPVFNIYGGGSDTGKEVKKAAKAAEDDFVRRFKDYLHQQRRLSYA